MKRENFSMKSIGKKIHVNGSGKSRLKSSLEASDDSVGFEFEYNRARSQKSGNGFA
jgi:hypothetical protein